MVLHVRIDRGRLPDHRGVPDERGSIVLRLSRLVAGVEDRGAHNRAGMEQTLDRLEAAAESA